MVTLIQTLDYYPYGTERIDTGTDISQRQFIGEMFDEETDLSYLNARYYEGSRGQFLSQDPVFWEIGLTNDGKSILSNPQAQNSYSYALNNPILLKDSSGRCPICLPLIGAGIGYLATYAGDIMDNRANGATGLDAFQWSSSLGEYATGVAVGTASMAPLPGGPGIALLRSGGISTLGSLAEDYMGEYPIDLKKATASGLVTIASGGILKGAVGTVAKRNLFRYQIVGETFQTASGLVTTNAIQSSSNNSSNNGSLVRSSGSFVNVSSQVRGWLNTLKPFMTKSAQKALKKAGF
jgi:RHS repeat-associated protein